MVNDQLCPPSGHLSWLFPVPGTPSRLTGHLSKDTRTAKAKDPLPVTTLSHHCLFPARCQPLPRTLSTYLPISLGVSLGAQMVKNLLAMQETWVQSLGQEDPLEKGMATHPSISAWRIPWTEEPGQLQSMGSQRVRHNRLTDTCWLESQPFQKAGVCFSQPLR